MKNRAAVGSWNDSSTLDYSETGLDDLAVLIAREKERHSKFMEI